MDYYQKVLDLQIPGHVTISPDGTKVVFATSLLYDHKTSDHSLSTICLASVGQADSAHPLTNGQSYDRLPRWSPDGQSVAFVSDRANPGKSSAIFLYSLDNNKIAPITDFETERSIEQLSWSPNGQSIAYLSADEESTEHKQTQSDQGDAQVYGKDKSPTRLRIVKLASKTASVLVSKDQHIADLAWSPAGDHIAYVLTEDGNFESIHSPTNIEVVSIESKTIRHLAGVPWGPVLYSGGGSLRWIHDELFLPGLARAGTVVTSRVLYSLSIHDGSRTKRNKDETCCLSDFCDANGEVLLSTLNGVRTEIRTLDDRVLVSSISSISTFDAAKIDGKIVIALVKSDLNTPDEIYTMTSDQPDLVRITNYGAHFKTPIGRAIPLTTKSDDGKVDLEAIYFLPITNQDPQTPQNPHPTFVLNHGGPYSRVNSAFTIEYSWPQLLLHSGYGVLCPNYRGSSGRGTFFAESYSAGTTDYADVITLIQYAIEQGLADKDRFVIGGWSQGGFLAYLAAVRNGTHGHGWRFRGAVAKAGVSDWDSMMICNDAPSAARDIAGSFGEPWTLDKSDTRSRQGSALWEFREAAEAGRVPDMLILHGQEDERVPVTQAWGFQRACRRWGVPCEMVTYPRSGHCIKERKQLMDMARRILKFCDCHFG